MKKVGVFVNQSYDEIMKMIDDYHLDVVQLHGDEPVELCQKLSEQTEVIKVFRITRSRAAASMKLFNLLIWSATTFFSIQVARRKALGERGFSLIGTFY